MWCGEDAFVPNQRGVMLILHGAYRIADIRIGYIRHKECAWSGFRYGIEIMEYVQLYIHPSVEGNHFAKVELLLSNI